MHQSPDRPADPIALIRELDEAIRDEGATYILDRCVHYDLLVDCRAELARLHAAHQELEKQHAHDGLLGSMASGTATALRHAAAWQPIETAPKDGLPFLSWGPRCYLGVARWVDGAYRSTLEEISLRQTCAWTGYRPTHWMPLPEPPKD